MPVPIIAILLLFATPDIPAEEFIHAIPAQRVGAIRVARHNRDEAIKAYDTLILQEIADAPKPAKGVCGDWRPGLDDGDSVPVLIWHSKECPGKEIESQ
jgi:hypothetical protein